MAITRFPLFLLVTFLLLPKWDALGATSNKPHKVLLLNSYHTGYPWAEEMNAAALRMLQRADLPIETYVEFMDTKRIAPEKKFPILEEYLRRTYGNTRFDLILAFDNNALDFVLSRRDPLFPGVPVIFSGINNYEEEMLQGQINITGVCEDVDFAGNIELMLDLHPRTRYILTIADATVTAQKSLRTFRQARIPYLGRVTFKDYVDLNGEELKAELARAPQDSLIFLVSWNRDRDGTTYTAEESQKLIQSACNLPVYTGWDFRVGHGAVGGLVANGATQGERAGEMALAFFDGVALAHIPVLNRMQSLPLFDYEQLNRFGIDPSQLPKNSVILHPPYNYLRENPLLFSLLVAAAVLQFIIILGLIHFMRYRRRSEQSIREHETRYRELINNLEDLVWRFNTEGILTFANPATREMLGYEPEEILGKHFTCVLTEESARVAMHTFQRRLQGASPEKIMNLELRYQRKDGTSFLGESCTTPLRDQEGNLVEIQGTTRDISHRYRHQQEKIELEEQVRQAQKMDALGRLAGGVAHDFNNLLQAIQGYADLTLHQLNANHTDSRDNVEQILSATRRAGALVRQLLAFSRKEEIHPVYLNLNLVVQNMSKLLKRVLGEQVTLDLSLERHLASIFADTGQVEQIILNLCINARDAMAEGGVITLKTENRRLEADFCADHSWAREGEYVCLSIEDTGQGMAPEVLDRIFEPFFTTKGKGKGTGLGLSIVYNIVKQQKGVILAHSEEGEGACFDVFLPAVHRPQEKKNAQNASAAQVRGGTETILVAEDDELVRALVRQVLERSGYKVLIAHDGEEAITLYDGHDGPIQMALLDVIMPKANGRGVMEHIRKNAPTLPILFTSGYSRKYLGEDFQFDELTDLITKPCAPQDLLRKVRQMLDVGAGTIARSR